MLDKLGYQAVMYRGEDYVISDAAADALAALDDQVAAGTLTEDEAVRQILVAEGKLED